MFRPPFEGKDGLRRYLEDAFGEETEPTVAWFGEPVVHDGRASVEYWARCRFAGEPMTIAGCTVLVFDADGLLVEARDYSSVEPGDHTNPPASMLG